MLGVKTFCDKFKLDVTEVDSRPAFYLNALKERYIFATMSDNIPKILRGIKEDPREKLYELQSLIATLAVDSVESKDVLYSDDVDARIRDYEERMKSLGVTYLSMGCEDMDKVFYGYRKQDLITIGGKAGQGKSWLLVYLTYLLEKVILEKEEMTGETYGDILFITNEMGEEEIKERIDCIRFRLPFEGFLKGSLTEREKGRYYRGLESLRKTRSKIRIVYSCQTIDELTTYMGLYQPSAVFIDGSYLMEGKMQEGWEKIVYITRNLKRIAKSFKTPIINTTQLKRGSNKTGSKFALDGQGIKHRTCGEAEIV
jgi:replicative DNA helicase